MIEFTNVAAYRQFDERVLGWEVLLSAAQCRMARAAAGLSRPELAKRAQVSVGTISDFERGLRDPYTRTLRDIQDALEEQGVTFLEATDAGSGVRYRD